MECMFHTFLTVVICHESQREPVMNFQSPVGIHAGSACVWAAATPTSWVFLEGKAVFLHYWVED